MKKYLEVKILIEEQSTSNEILVARLSEMGFDSFVEEEAYMLAYCIDEGENTDLVREAVKDLGFEVAAMQLIEDQNWNAAWEASYEAVSILGRVGVRAPFHEAQAGLEYDIIIEPKMSFGTAHHETTDLMLQLILDLDTENRSVLDMGSGTAVLAILAWKKGARDVLAIDNDEWAYNNALENVSLNNTDIKVELGDAGTINKRVFDIIFANINRNILLEDIPAYAIAVNPGGSLLLSGFYENDLQQIKLKCEECGLIYKSHKMKNKWVAAVFNKR